MAKTKVPQKYQAWIDARKKHGLSHAQIQMARELGMDPKKFGGLRNHHQQPWKLPIGAFIEKCYLKSFGRLPETVLSIEDRIKQDAAKKAQRRERKLQAREASASGTTPDEVQELDY